jgi:hypothetical protein
LDRLLLAEVATGYVVLLSLSQKIVSLPLGIFSTIAALFSLRYFAEIKTSSFRYGGNFPTIARGVLLVTFLMLVAMTVAAFYFDGLETPTTISRLGAADYWPIVPLVLLYLPLVVIDIGNRILTQFSLVNQAYGGMNNIYIFALLVKLVSQTILSHAPASLIDTRLFGPFATTLFTWFILVAQCRYTYGCLRRVQPGLSELQTNI